MLKRSLLTAVLVIGALIAGCASQPGTNPPGGVSGDTPTGVAAIGVATLVAATPSPAARLSPEAPAAAAGTVSSCQLTPVVAPTMAPNPGYAALDPTTGLHVTGSPTTIDLASYRLKVTGLVDHPLSLSYDELRCMPKVTTTPTLICPGYFQDVATWSGVQLKYVLGLAGVQDGAKSITMLAADQYGTRMDLKDALMDENLLAYEWNGQPVPVLHGFPLRAVFPSMQGSNWVKWLLEIKVE